MSPRVVSAAEWLAARKELQAAEEQAMRTLQQIASRRREMPAVRIEKDYVFDGPDGKASMLDLFDGRTQLIVQHFMFDPAWDEGCPVCSYQADSVGHLAHLHARNTTFAAVSRAPISKIEPFRQRMGWTFPWYSSYGSDFNYDFHATHDESVAPIEYNYRTAQELIDSGEPFFARPGEQGGVSGTCAHRLIRHRARPRRPRRTVVCCGDPSRAAGRPGGGDRSRVSGQAGRWWAQ